MLILVAFIGGLICLLSPCTLSVIPLLFSGMQGRPRQIIAMLSGMVIMFTLVALLVNVAGEWISSATIIGRWLALTFLTVSAITLISPRMADFVTSPFVRIGNGFNNLSLNTGGVVSCFWGGLAVGLLWAPCAGPILGAIFSLRISGHSPVPGSILLAAYGTGCAVMLAFLVWGGRKLITPIRSHAALMFRLRQTAGVVMLAAVVMSMSGVNDLLQGASGLENTLEQQVFRLVPQSAIQPMVHIVNDPQISGSLLFDTSNIYIHRTSEVNVSSMMPSLSGGTGWINGEPVSPESLRGKVVLIDFWTFGCINCQHALPHVREWAQKYSSLGLVVIGVHTPEFPWEKPLSSVKRAVEKWELPYRVVTDNNETIWKAFGNNYWPAQYYFDAKGQLRYTSYGEGNYEKQEEVIQQLINETHV